MAKKREIVEELDKAFSSSSRRDKIEAIYNYASDELELIADWVEIAAESLDELNERLQGIIDYYNN